MRPPTTSRALAGRHLSRFRAAFAILAALALAQVAGSAAENPAPLVHPEDLLGRLTSAQLPAHGAPLAAPAIEAANAALDRLTSGAPIPVRFQLSIAAIFVNPSDLSLYCDAPNSLGYPISVFAHFTDDWKLQLGKLKPGDPIDFTGTVADARFRSEPGKSSLSITVDHCALAGDDLQTPLLKAISQGSSWDAAALPGNWKVVSLDPVIQARRVCPPVFGLVPPRVIVFCRGTSIYEAEVIYMQGGYNLSFWKKNDAATLAAYHADFDRMKVDLPARLEALTGSKGKPVTVTAAAPNFSFDFTEYPYQGLVLRLYIEDQKSIFLWICRPQDAVTALLRLPSLEQRRKDLAANVTRSANGDVLIAHLPVIDQDGRPFCGAACWTEIARYYGLEIFQEMMLHGERDGGKGVDGAAWFAKEYIERKDFDLAHLKHSIDTGNPVWFAEHGHVALITGYNSKTNEIFRTDSWGEGSRNQGMPYDKFMSRAVAFMYFNP